MGLLMSDTLLLDPALNEALGLLDTLREWPYPSDTAGDATNDESADLPAWLTFGTQREPTTGRRSRRL